MALFPLSQSDSSVEFTRYVKKQIPSISFLKVSPFDTTMSR